MRISRNWLLDYIDISHLSDVEIAEGLTRSGIEVEGYRKLVDIDNVTVAQVTNVKEHPSSDKLKVCSVNIGGGQEVEVVCGASNVSEYIKVAYANLGSTVAGKKIEEVEIRGVKSLGMLCSLEELGIDSSYLDDKNSEGILILPSSSDVGKNVFELLELNDTVYELGLTPNRSDCMSIFGVAYELSAIFEIPLKKKIVNYPVIDNDKSLVELLVSNENVNYFSLMPLHQIKVKESPNYIKSRLLASGIKLVNNVVDITNYILIELGQPMHAFDLKRSGVDIEVRSAFKNESVTTLDENSVDLNQSDIVVANQSKALSIAGVMGGFESRVTKYTTDIMLECALFDSDTIRKTSKNLGIRSESSIRFEKGVDYNRCELAMQMAVSLLIEHADAKVSINPVTFNKEVAYDNSPITLKYNKLTKYVGHEIPVEEVGEILKRLQFSFKYENQEFSVNRLSRRSDISSDVCLIEEIVRLYGLEKITPVLPSLPVKRSFVQGFDAKTIVIKSNLQSMGFNESINYSLTSKKKAAIDIQIGEELISLKNPLSSEREYLRKSLIPTLIDTVLHNISREGENIRMYEISNICYLFNGEYVSHRKLSAVVNAFTVDIPLHNIKMENNFYLIKGAVEKILSLADMKEGIDYDIKATSDIPEIFHPYQSAEIVANDTLLGYVGKIHPSYSKHGLFAFELDLDKVQGMFGDTKNVGEISAFPSVTRDISIVVPDNVKAIDMIKSVNQLEVPLLEEITVYNVYKDEKLGSNKSVTFKLRFRSNESTLSDEMVSNEIERIINEFKVHHSGVLR